MATGGQDVSGDTSDFLCNTCKQDKDVNVSAVEYCRACCEYFCEGCLAHHNGKVVKKDHAYELLGKDTLRNMLSTRLMTASPVPHSPDDVLFCCRNCNDADDAGDLRTAVDYCRTCSEYLCNTCLFAHNKWTKHADKLLGKEDMKSMINARNRSRRRTFDRTLSTKNDITKHTENYCRLAVLIVKGCTRIMRVLFLRHVESSTPAGHPHSPWSVDEFLLANKTEICKRLGKEKGMLPGIKESILFPSRGATDLEKWDLVLLSFILLDVCNYKEQKPLAMYLNKMKRVRNSICHRGDASVNNEDFDRHFDELKTCIEKCSKHLADRAITDEMHTLVHNVEHSVLSLDESSKLLKQWYDRDRHIEERLEQHDLALRATHAEVETVGTDVQAMGIDMRTVVANIVAMMPKIDDIHECITNSGGKLGVPDTKIGIYMKNSGPQKERILSEKLVNMIDPQLRNHPKLKAELSEESFEIIYQHVQEAIKRVLSDDRELFDVSSKCVILSIRCSSYNSFKDLLYQSRSGELTELFKPVERAIQDIEGYEHVELEVVVSDEDFVTAMDELVRNILTACGFTQDELAAEQRRLINEAELETIDSAVDQSIRDVSILSAEECEELTGRKQQEGTCILIDIKPRSIGHYIHIVENSTSESMKVALQDLAAVLRDYYQLKDLSIEAMPIDAKTHRHHQYQEPFSEPEVRPKLAIARTEEECSEDTDEPTHSKLTADLERPQQIKQPEKSTFIKRAFTSVWSMLTGSKQEKKPEYTDSDRKSTQSYQQKQSETRLSIKSDSFNPAAESQFPDEVKITHNEKSSQMQNFSKDSKGPRYTEKPYIKASKSSTGMERVIETRVAELELFERVVGSKDTKSSISGKYSTDYMDPPSSRPKAWIKTTEADADRFYKISQSPGEKVKFIGRIEKVTIRESGDKELCWARGLCSLPDGGWLVLDDNNKVLKRLDGTGSVVDRCTMPFDTQDVCFIQDDNVAVVTGLKAKRVELVSLDGDSMTRVRSIQMGHTCYSVTYVNKKLYTTSWRRKEIYEHDYMDGRLVRTISLRGVKRSCQARYITSSEDGSRLFMTECNGGFFIIDTRTGDVIQQVDVGRYPYGVCLGEGDRLFVAAYSSGVIHIDWNGAKLGTAVTLGMLERRPAMCVSYDKRAARLAVTVHGVCDYIFLFHMK